LRNEEKKSFIFLGLFVWIFKKQNRLFPVYKQVFRAEKSIFSLKMSCFSLGKGLKMVKKPLVFSRFLVIFGLFLVLFDPEKVDFLKFFHRKNIPGFGPKKWPKIHRRNIPVFWAFFEKRVTTWSPFSQVRFWTPKKRDIRTMIFIKKVGFFTKLFPKLGPFSLKK
jgi:hypothetical protein